MSKSYSDDGIANPSHNPHFASIAEIRLSRRGLLKAAGAVSALSVLSFAGCATTGPARGVLGFAAIPVSMDDAIHVPPGYTATPFYSWGDPIGHSAGSPAFKPDAGNTATEQALQAGMHHDGIHYFPLPYGSGSSTRGLLAMNHEYTDDRLLHADGFANWNAEKVQKAQNAHGCSVIEIILENGKWRVVRPSPYARRVTAATRMRVNGPAAGRRCGVGSREAHSARPLQPRRRVHDARRGRSPGRLHGRRPRLRIHLQVRLREPRQS